MQKEKYPMQEGKYPMWKPCCKASFLMAVKIPTDEREKSHLIAEKKTTDGRKKSQCHYHAQLGMADQEMYNFLIR